MTACSAVPRRAAPRRPGGVWSGAVSASAPSPFPVPLPPPGRPRAFHRHLASPRRRACSCHTRSWGSRRRHGSRPAHLPLRPPASRRHGCLPFPAQHGEVLRGRGWRTAPAATLRLLRHARLACLHGGEAGGVHRLAAVGREGTRWKKGAGEWGYPPGRVQIESLRPQRQFGGRHRERAWGREGAAGAWGPCACGQLGSEALAMWGEAPSAHWTALSPCLRAIALVPVLPSRLLYGVTFCVGVKMKRGTVHLLLRGIGE